MEIKSLTTLSSIKSVFNFIGPGRLIFILAFLSVLSSGARAQVTADPSRPFGQGDEIILPGTSLFLGDLPHEIGLKEGETSFHTISGLLSTKVGRFKPGISVQTGLRQSTPGIFFEGIAYPFYSADLLNWAPSIATAQILDFPAAAWWGPHASNGGVLLQTPGYPKEKMGEVILWGGDNDMLGGDVQFRADRWVVEGNYQHGISSGPSYEDAADFTAKGLWIQDESSVVETGILGLERLHQDYWYSAFTRVKFFSSNFQSLEIKPFFQKALDAGQGVQEFGGQVNYHFNMGGLAESHLGGGFAHGDLTSAGASKNDGYVQTSNFFDILGFGSVDFSLRMDFSNLEPTMFNDLFGFQYRAGLIIFLGDYEKNVEPPSGDVQQGELGFRFQPDDKLCVTLKYVYQDVGFGTLNGERAQLFWGDGRFSLLFIRRIKAEIEEQWLADLNGLNNLDAGGKVEFSLAPKSQFWFSGRGFNGSPIYWTVGGRYEFTDDLRLMVELSNVDNLQIAWPDPNARVGRVFRCGMLCKF